jgi:phytoene dehydrogenase-like protein
MSSSISVSGTHPKRAVIVGSGFGGLALAIRLQAAGVQVTVLEKREKIGGRAYQLKDQGYTFDMGPSLITAPHIIESVFQAAGRKLSDYVELLPLDPYYRIYFHDGTQIDYVGDPERMKAQMAVQRPGCRALRRLHEEGAPHLRRRHRGPAGLQVLRGPEDHAGLHPDLIRSSRRTSR